MKHLVFIAVLVAQTCMSQAQVTSVVPVTMNMSQGIQSGFKVLIPEVEGKEAQRGWEKLMKQYGGKTLKVPKSSDLVSSNVFIPSVEDTAIQVFSNFNSTPDGVYLSVFLKSGNQYYHYNSDKSPAIQSLLKKFATSTAFDAVSKRLDRESKELDKLEREKRNLVKDKETYEKEIKRAKETIEKREKDLVENADAQRKKQSSIIEKKKMINKTKVELGKYEK